MKSDPHSSKGGQAAETQSDSRVNGTVTYIQVGCHACLLARGLACLLGNVYCLHTKIAHISTLFTDHRSPSQGHQCDVVHYCFILQNDHPPNNIPGRLDPESDAFPTMVVWHAILVHLHAAGAAGRCARHTTGAHNTQQHHIQLDVFLCTAHAHETQPKSAPPSMTKYTHQQR